MKRSLMIVAALAMLPGAAQIASAADGQAIYDITAATAYLIGKSQ